MKKIPPTTVILELVFHDKEKTLKLLDTLDADARVAINITRARLDVDSAWMVLELRGQGPRLREVADLLNDAAVVKDPSWRPFSRAS